MSLKILIADDEKEARALIVHFLKEMPLPCHATEACDGISASRMLEEQVFDIIFLDIKMPGNSGIDILRKLPQNNLPAVILTTAFEKHALTAFDHNAIDYLLKPFNKERFRKALEKATDHVKMKELKKQNHYLSTISIKHGSKTLLVPVHEIEFFQTDDEYISAFTDHNRHLLSSTLNELENSLDPSAFIRIHKSTIVNIACIHRIENHPSGDFTITTRTGRQLRGSRNYKEKIRPVVANTVSKGGH